MAIGKVRCYTDDGQVRVYRALAAMKLVSNWMRGGKKQPWMKSRPDVAIDLKWDDSLRFCVMNFMAVDLLPEIMLPVKYFSGAWHDCPDFSDERRAALRSVYEDAVEEIDRMTPSAWRALVRDSYGYHSEIDEIYDYVWKHKYIEGSNLGDEIYESERGLKHIDITAETIIKMVRKSMRPGVVIWKAQEESPRIFEKGPHYAAENAYCLYDLDKKTMLAWFAEPAKLYENWRLRLVVSDYTKNRTLFITDVIVAARVLEFIKSPESYVERSAVKTEESEQAQARRKADTAAKKSIIRDKIRNSLILQQENRASILQKKRNTQHSQENPYSDRGSPRYKIVAVPRCTEEGVIIWAQSALVAKKFPKTPASAQEFEKLYDDARRLPRERLLFLAISHYAKVNTGATKEQIEEYFGGLDGAAEIMAKIALGHRPEHSASEELMYELLQRNLQM